MHWGYEYGMSDPMMWGMAIWGALWTAAAILLVLWPVGVLLRRIGYSPWWALLALVPPLALIGVWVLAYAPWPRDRVIGRTDLDLS